MIRSASGSRAQCRLGGLPQEPVAAGGHHYRIQDHDGGAHLLQPAADGVDHRGVAQHADLDGVDADVVADGVQLRGEESAGGTWTARTPWVFCAVRAVMAAMP